MKKRTTEAEKNNISKQKARETSAKTVKNACLELKMRLKWKRGLLINRPGYGDHIFVKRINYGANHVYEHHGIYIGNDKVIHFHGDSYLKMWQADIITSTLDFFSGGLEITIVQHKNCFPVTKTVELAKSFLKMQKGKYNLFHNNCEHFCYYCKTGEKKSPQVQKKVLAFLKILVKDQDK